MVTIDIDKLLTRTDAFFRTVYVVRDHFGLQPKKDHLAAVLNQSDLIEMRRAFVRELSNTITAFVYAPEKQEKLVSRFADDGRDRSSAWNYLRSRARDKFRRSSQQGQFCELLLYNILQHYFKAAPLLRKMQLTTNPEVERHGADAIHVAREGDRYVLYLGEAKAYDRNAHALRDALVDSIRSAVSHYHGHRDELNLYTYEDFLPPDLEMLASSYIEGKLENVEVRPICLAAYSTKSEVSGETRGEILQNKINEIHSATASLASHPVFAQVPSAVLNRMTYIIFPMHRMDELIDDFGEELGYGGRHETP